MPSDAKDPRCEEFEKLRKELHAVLWPLIKPDDAEGEKFNWQLKSGTSREETGLIYKGHCPSIGTVWKTELLLDISVDQHRENFAGQNLDWVPHLGDYKILEKSPDGNWSVTYSVSLIGYGISDRDFLNLQFLSCLEDGSLYDIFTAYPKEHPADPKNPKIVRGVSLPSGTLTRPVPGDPTRCLYTFINNFDLKGYVPRKVINLFTTSFMTVYNKAIIAEARRIRNNNKKN